MSRETERSGEHAERGARPSSEVFSPWTVVHMVFDQLSAQGLHPVLGDTGDPSVPAAELLRALGVEPGQPALGDGHLARAVREDLSALRAQYSPVEPARGDEV